MPSADDQITQGTQVPRSTVERRNETCCHSDYRRRAGAERPVCIFMGVGWFGRLVERRQGGNEEQGLLGDGNDVRREENRLRSILNWRHDEKDDEPAWSRPTQKESQDEKDNDCNGTQRDAGNSDGHDGRHGDGTKRLEQILENIGGQDNKCWTSTSKSNEYVQENCYMGK